MFLTGCARSLPDRLYVLNPLSATPQAESIPNDDYLKLAIGPIEIPGYLDRPQIVTRKGGNRIELSESNKWAEPLQENLSRVLSENLGTLLGPDAFVIVPWRGSTSVDYRVSVDVIRFDGALSESVTLAARWSIFNKGGKRLLMRKTSSYTEAVASTDFASLVSAQSAAVASLSREIARELQHISHTPAGQ